MEPPAPALLFAALVLLAINVAPTCSSAPAPLNCTEAGRVCTSFIAYKTGPNVTVALLRSMFDASPGDLTADAAGSPGYVFVRKNCSCLYDGEYVANTTFTVRKEVSSVYPVVAEAYAGLAYLPDAAGAATRAARAATRAARAEAVVWLHLLCGCSSGLWNYLMSYVAEAGDTVESLSSRFGVSMDSIETANGMPGPDGLVVGDVYYIPMNSVPGQPYGENADTSPSPAPAPKLKLNTSSETPHHGSTQFPYGWVFGSMGLTFILIIVALLCASCKFFSSTNDIKGSYQPTPRKFHVLQSSSFCYGSRRYFCCNGKCASTKPSTRDSENHQAVIPKGVVGDTFEMEKPIVFKHEQVLSATDSFSDANLLGHGIYGSVYYGILLNQEVAIKRMTATKTKEFMVEMKVLCKVHHASLVELIGYAASDCELFLIYEYVHKGALKNHLHDPQNKGHTPLNWISRVQIALDAARGLEYIHEHTKNHYIHRDIKTSNILLDSSSRAKISDFGLAKLVVKTSDGEASATKVVGTFGYLAPEYLCEGMATPKTDVYAFGVVLFELISGKEAITRTKGLTSICTERRSLASIMLAALRNSSNSITVTQLKDYIDPNLMGLYPPDCVCRMAMLANQCVDEEPTLRPDMKQVVISLSHILLSSVEWEATLAGNSQVFSGLVQGR